MTDWGCKCVECCEYRAARDDNRACAEQLDHIDVMRERAWQEWARSSKRFTAAFHARDASAHNGAA